MTRLTPRPSSMRPRPFAAAAPVIVALTLFSGAAGGSESAAVADPCAAIRAMSQDLAAATTAAGIADRLHAMERAAARHTDFEHMARRVLDRHWGTSSPAQRERFVEAFRTWMIHTFSQQIASFVAGDASLSPAQTDATGTLATVRAKVSPDSGPAIELDYRLRRTGGPWKLVDLTVEGMSLVSTYGGSFRAQARSLGMDALIERMVARNRYLQAG